MLKVYNLRTGSYEIEKTAGSRWLDGLYGTGTGRFLLELLIKHKVCSFLCGKLCDTRISAKMIKRFVEKYNIDLSECVKGIHDFRSFNDFFTRKLKPEARKFDPDPNLLLSPGDGRMRVLKDIDTRNILQVKGLFYSLDELLLDRELAEKYEGGICIILRLAPVDYHRFHFVDSGVCSRSRTIKGFYYSVNPRALHAIPKLYCKNNREVSLFRSDNFSDITYVEIGAKFVGTIVQTYKPGIRVERGAEKGYFKFGGSTCILLFEKNSAVINEQILDQTQKGYEVKVLAGDVIGVKG